MTRLARRLLGRPVALLRGAGRRHGPHPALRGRRPARLSAPAAARRASPSDARAACSRRRCDAITRARARAPELIVLLLMLGLEGEPAHLWLQLRDQVADAGQVVARLAQPDRSLVASHLQALDAGCLLEQLATFLGAQRERRIDRPLPHDDELVRPEPSLAEELDDVTQPRAGTVDQVLALTGPIRAPPDRDLGEVDRQPAVTRCRGSGSPRPCPGPCAARSPRR